MTAQADWIRSAPYVIVTRRIGETVYVGCTAYADDADTLTIAPVPAPGGLDIPTVIRPGQWIEAVVYEATGSRRCQFISHTPCAPVLPVEFTAYTPAALRVRQGD
jgi:hypothetical protein